MSFREAEGVLSANVGVDHTGDFAPVVVAALVGRAVRILGTFDSEAANLVVLRITEISFLAATDGLTSGRY